MSIPDNLFEPVCSCCVFWECEREFKDNYIFCTKVNRWVPDLVEEDQIECPCYVKYTKEEPNG